MDLNKEEVVSTPKKRSRVGLWLMIVGLSLVMFVNSINVYLIYEDVQLLKKHQRTLAELNVVMLSNIDNILELMESNDTKKPFEPAIIDENAPQNFDTVLVEVIYDGGEYQISYKSYLIYPDGSRGWNDKRTRVKTKAGVDSIFTINGWTDDWREKIESND